ncbi:MAG: energy-coupling factor transporter transmembrane protein EcfT [Treponema sp.]|jgi:biotin transport system permease protein|nr:energy-coupling factor transporter transmembrane protein EcfT [Treponema sp.]
MGRNGKAIKTAPGIPFGYRPGDSPLHRCPALIKLLALLLLSIFSYGSLPALAAAACIISAGAIVAGIRPWELLRGGRPILILALAFFLLRIIRLDGAPPFFRVDAAEVPGGLAQSLSMIASFAGGALLFAATTMKELRGGLEKCAAGIRGPAGRALPLHRFSLALSLMLGFLPRFFEIWEETGMALDARCVRGRIRRLLLMIPPVVERMIEKALDTALALESRGLGAPDSR